MKLQRAELGRLEPLGSGGQSHVYRLPEFTLPDVPGPLVYKEYHAGTGMISEPGLASVIGFRERLPADQRQFVDKVSAWPLGTVLDDRLVRGVVMREIPDSFMHHIALIGGQLDRIPRSAQFLFVDRRKVERVGIEFAEHRARLVLCAHLAYVLAFLHHRDVMFGDLSGNNVVFRLEPSAGVMLVDCDAVRKVGTSAIVDQLHTPDWIPPEGQDAPQTVATDLYKFGLFVLRVLDPRDGSSVNVDPSSLDGRLGSPGDAMLRRALSRDPARRTRAKDWHAYLKAAVAQHPATS